MASDLAQFEALLLQILSPDNDVRAQSENAYENIPVTTRLQLLVGTIRNNESKTEIQSLASVLLRRILVNDFESLWPSLPEEIKTGLKQELMAAIQQKCNISLRKKICDVFAELARNMLDDSNNMTWPEALRFMFESANSEDPELRECALHILKNTPGIFGNQQTHYLEVAKQMLGQCLMERSISSVRVEAVKATTSFLAANDKDQTVLGSFRDLLPHLIEAVVEELQKDDDSEGLLKCLIELAENVPKFLRTQLDNIIPFCLKVVSDANQTDQLRQLALECLVSLSETAPPMMRKQTKYIPLLVPQVLAMMVDLEDDPQWAMQDEAEDEDTDNNSIAAESALDRLACALGGKTMLPHIITNVSQMLAHNDWRYRHAALMAISACGEGCHTHMEQLLPNIMEALLPHFKDPHPRVRYAVCNAVGQMCTDFGPLYQKKYHQVVVPALLSIMEDEMHPRVQAHGAAALVNFSEECPKKILVQYLDTIIGHLESMLNSKLKELVEKGNKLVLEQVVTTLASVADAVEERFLQYYDRFMPCLKYIVENANVDKFRLLRGKTIECISLIGLAVGKEKFMQDCNDVMQLLLKTQTAQDDIREDDPQISYMISAWARMCRILGREFQQYLPLVMPAVLKAASLKPEVAVLDNDDVKDMEDDADWQFVTLGDQQSFGIRTAGLEEKATACQMLVCYARELKEAFAAYAEQVVQIMVPLLKFYFHDDVRIAASESLPFLIDCAEIQGEQYQKEMWNFICPFLLKAIEIEPEQTVLPEHLNSLAKCIEKIGKGCMNDEQLHELMQLLDKMLKEHFEKQAQRQEKRKDEDYDEIVEESLIEENDEDVYVLSKIADIFHAFFGTHQESFLPIFEQILPHYVKMLAPEQPWPDRQWALCVWDDVLEHTGPASLKYQEYFLPPLLSSLEHRAAEVRQAAAYGVGVMAQFGGEAYAQACAGAIPTLVKMIEDPESRSIENVNATENAISAVVKICKYNASQTGGVDELISRLVYWLPVTEDTDEAVHIYNYMCDLLAVNHPGLIGENNQNLPRIVMVIAEAFAKEAVSPEQEVFQRMLSVIRQVQSNEAVFQACVAQMSPEQQKCLSTILAS